MATTDELERRWRDEFPSLDGCVHLISHSLGATPRGAAGALAEFADLWSKRSITAWELWLPEVDRAAARIERLLGAPRGTVAMNQNVSTIQALLASCLEYRPERNEIVYDDQNFPSVSYVWKAEERRGARVAVVTTPPGSLGVPTDRLCAAITERTLIVPISYVNFRNSYVQDAKRIVAHAHSVGAMVVLDTYQAVGAIPVDVVDLDVDFACGGSVKWLCGGPGAAYLYVKPELISRFSPRLTGWFGHAEPFAFTMPEQRYAEGIWRYIGGTPAIAPLYQARAGAEILGTIDAAALRAKSLRQTRRLIEWVDEAGFILSSPRADAQRGGTVVFDFPGSGAVAQELNRRRFFCDHRPGSGIRVSPHFYTRDDELEAFVHELRGQVR